jgi:hypothetical protein
VVIYELEITKADGAEKGGVVLIDTRKKVADGPCGVAYPFRSLMLAVANRDVDYTYLVPVIDRWGLPDELDLAIGTDSNLHSMAEQLIAEGIIK